MKRDDFMQKAIDLAKKNVLSNNGGPFAAIIVKDHTILASGCNVVTTANDPTAHAEITCIRNACQELQTFDLSGCDLYATCEPCPMCLGAIYWARLKQVFYAATRHDADKAGFNDAFIYEELSRKQENRTILFEQCLRQNALDIFSVWKTHPYKTHY